MHEVTFVLKSGKVAAMDIFITHTSALQYWRINGKAQYIRGRRQFRGKLPVRPLDTYTLRKSTVWGLASPIDVMVNTPHARRKSKMVRPHVFCGTFPNNSFIDVGDGLFVASPELCFFQMANELPFIKLIELGFELCGSYSLSETSYSDKEKRVAEKVPYGRSPLTSTKKLQAFVDRMAGVRGRRPALRALRYITDNSASPMETILVMLLILPYRLGGYGLPIPELNSRITPAKTIKRSSSKAFYSCDLFWPDVDLVAEYDSDSYHTGAERIASDSKRRNAITSAGILVITVTNQQIRSIVEFEKVAKLLAINMDKQLRYKNPGFLEAQRKLRGLLL